MGKTCCFCTISSGEKQKHRSVSQSHEQMQDPVYIWSQQGRAGSVLGTKLQGCSHNSEFSWDLRFLLITGIPPEGINLTLELWVLSLIWYHLLPVLRSQQKVKLCCLEKLKLPVLNSAVWCENWTYFRGESRLWNMHKFILDPDLQEGFVNIYPSQWGRECSADGLSQCWSKEVC